MARDTQLASIVVVSCVSSLPASNSAVGYTAIKSWFPKLFGSSSSPLQIGHACSFCVWLDSRHKRWWHVRHIMCTVSHTFHNKPKSPCVLKLCATSAFFCSNIKDSSYSCLSPLKQTKHWKAVGATRKSFILLANTMQQWRAHK